MSAVNDDCHREEAYLVNSVSWGRPGTVLQEPDGANRHASLLYCIAGSTQCVNESALC
jgi:hypothetical protein